MEEWQTRRASTVSTPSPLPAALSPTRQSASIPPTIRGVLFDKTLVSRYLLTNLEYRRELLSFMYLHLRSTFIWADRETIIGGNQIGFKSDNGQSASVGLMSGFFWNSRNYL